MITMFTNGGGGGDDGNNDHLLRCSNQGNTQRVRDKGQEGRVLGAETLAETQWNPGRCIFIVRDQTQENILELPVRFKKVSQIRGLLSFRCTECADFGFF